jgi:hypothetical protein
VSKHIPEHDPRSRFEDEGIPDLQEGTPAQQRSSDPQEAPLPGDAPVAVDDYGTTNEEQAQGETLAGRLDREVPEEQPVFGAEDTETSSGEEGAAVRRAGRLVAPDEGVREDAEPAEIATEVGPDGGGYTAEEAAVRIEPE